MTRLFLAFYAPLILAYGDSLVWIWDRWWLGDYYSHGPLLPCVAAVVLYNRRQSWAEVEARVDMRGWWFLGFGLVMRLCGAAQMVDSISAASLLFSIIGVVLLTVGMQRLRLVLPVIALMVFATPMPMDLTGTAAFELKEVAINGALAVGNFLGLGADRIGASIRIPGQEQMLPVADACGGLRSLLALTTLGYCLAFFIGSADATRRLTILLAMVPVAVLVNILRIVGLCFIAKHEDVQFAGTTGHWMMNMAAWVINIAILIGLDALLERRLRRRNRALAPVAPEVQA